MNWTHDCYTCIHLGSDFENDYYLHYDEVYPRSSTLIARFGEDGDYSSGLEFIMSNPKLNKALKLAFEQDLLSKDLQQTIKNHQKTWFKYCEEDKEYADGISKRWEGKTRFILK